MTKPAESRSLSARVELSYGVNRAERERAFAKLVAAAQERIEPAWPSAGFCYRDNQERANEDAGEELEPDELPAFSMSPIVCWSDGPGQAAVEAALSDLSIGAAEIAGVRIAPIPLVECAREVSDQAAFAVLIEASGLGAGPALREWVEDEHPAWDYRSFNEPYQRALSVVWQRQNPGMTPGDSARASRLLQDVSMEGLSESLTLARLAHELYTARPRGCDARSNWEVSNLLCWWHTGGEKLVRAANMPSRAPRALAR